MTTQHSPAPSAVADFYDRIGQIYGSAWGPNKHYGYWENDADDSSIEVATDRLTDMMIEGVAPQRGQRVLDIGCGIGHPALRLARKTGASIVGISVSHLHVARGNELAAEEGLADLASFEWADAMDLPYEDGSFDAAWAFESMWHMPDRGHVLSETARILRPGGRLAITDVIERGPVGPEARKILDHICENYAVNSLATIDEYRKTLADNGFVDVEIRDITPNVGRTLGLMADTVETVRDKLIEVIGEEETDARLNFMRLAGSTPESGYLYLTAVRA